MSILTAHGREKDQISPLVARSSTRFMLQKALYVFGLSHHLFYVGAVDNSGLRIIFVGVTCIITKNTQKISSGHIKERLHVLNRVCSQWSSSHDLTSLLQNLFVRPQGMHMSISNK